MSRKITYYSIPIEKFPNFVRMLYSNLNYVGGILTSEVKKQDIRLYLEEFSLNYNLLCTSSKYKANEDAGNGYSYIHVDVSF